MRLYYIFIFILIFSCQSNGSDNDNHWGGEFSDLISAVDISYYPTIAENGTLFYNDQGDQINFLNSLFEKGVNTIRLRLWVDPPWCKISSHL